MGVVDEREARLRAAWEALDAEGRDVVLLVALARRRGDTFSAEALELATAGPRVEAEPLELGPAFLALLPRFRAVALDVESVALGRLAAAACDRGDRDLLDVLAVLMQRRTAA